MSMLSKGPNALNLNAYTQGQQQYEDSQPQANLPSYPQLQNSQVIQDQFDNFIKQLNRYDQILNGVAQDLQQISAGEGHLMDFYPEFISATNYQSDQQKKLITTEDPELGKVLTNLQRTNKNLKQQVKAWTVQFARKTKLTETLLSENQILRKAITTKNKELVKLIRTISSTENQDIIELKEGLEILRQENGVLLDHLNQIKDVLVQKTEDEKMFRDALQEKRLQSLSVEKQSRDIQDREQHLSKTVLLMQDSLQQLLNRKSKLQSEKSRLLQFRQQYTGYQSSINQLHSTEQQAKQSIQRNLKAKFQTNQQQKSNLIQKIEDLTQVIQKQKQQTRNLQHQIQRKENRLQQFNKINKELKTKSQQNNEILAKIKRQCIKTVEQQGAICAEIEMLQTDVSFLRDQLKELDEKQKHLQSEYLHNAKNLQEKNAKILIQQRNKQIKQSKELQKKIFEQKLQQSLKQKQQKDWQVKIVQKKAQINELKSQMKQIRINQSKLVDMKSKIAQYS